MTNGTLMKVESTAICSLGAFCNTFDLHYAIISLENQQFLVFLRVALLHRFYTVFTVNSYAEVSRGTRDMHFGLSLPLIRLIFSCTPMGLVPRPGPEVIKLEYSLKEKNKAKLLVACVHVSASSQSLRFFLV